MYPIRSGNTHDNLTAATEGAGEKNKAKVEVRL